MNNIDIYNHAYNKMLEESGLDPDKYEREDGFFGILDEIKVGIDPGLAFANVFDLVHGFDISPDYVNDVIKEVKNGKQN